jgi:hypothetical protein
MPACLRILDDSVINTRGRASSSGRRGVGTIRQAQRSRASCPALPAGFPEQFTSKGRGDARGTPLAALTRNAGAAYFDCVQWRYIRTILAGTRVVVEKGGPAATQVDDTYGG